METHALDVELRPIVIQWEQLRFVYNGLLILEVLILLAATFWAGGVQQSTNELIDLLVTGAVVANVLYFAGPILDVYWAVFARFRAPLVWLLFPLGTMLAMILCPLVMFSFLEMAISN